MKFRVNPALRSKRVQIGDDFYQTGETYSTNKTAFGRDFAELTMPVRERQRVENELGHPSYISVTTLHPVFVAVDE